MHHLCCALNVRDKVSALIAPLAIIALIAALPFTPARSAGDPYLGMGNEPSTDPPGMRITVVPGAPAETAGLKSSDVVLSIDETDFTVPGLDVAATLAALLKGRQVGEQLAFRVYRVSTLYTLTVNGTVIESDFPLEELQQYLDQARPGDTVVLSSEVSDETLDITVTLGVRNDTTGPPFPISETFDFHLDDKSPEIRALLDELIEQQGITADTADLYARLDRRATPDDGYKLERLVYLLRDGLKGEALTWEIVDEVSTQVQTEPFTGFHFFDMQAALLDTGIAHFGTRTTSDPSGIERDPRPAQDYLDMLLMDVEALASYVQSAFADLSPEEIAFIDSQREHLTEVFRHEHYIDQDDPQLLRRAENVRLVELASRVSFTQMVQSGRLLGMICERGYLSIFA